MTDGQSALDIVKAKECPSPDAKAMAVVVREGPMVCALSVLE
jgi:hypothetical protein